MDDPATTEPGHEPPANPKVYTHELIDIIGHNRARYMHHMTANWSPIAREERNQLCFGVWGIVGTTGRWPAVVNMWEEDGFAGLAAGLAHETGTPSMQDPTLERWWAEAAQYRRGGIDRVMVPAPWTSPITDLCARGVHGALYAHETIRLREPGGSLSFLDEVRTDAVPAYAEHAWTPVTALRTAMHHDDECILIWAIPSWPAWAALEEAVAHRNALHTWRAVLHDRARSVERFLMMDAPLSPLRIGRQPSHDDRDPSHRSFAT